MNDIYERLSESAKPHSETSQETKGCQSERESVEIPDFLIEMSKQMHEQNNRTTA